MESSLALWISDGRKNTALNTNTIHEKAKARQLYGKFMHSSDDNSDDPKPDLVLSSFFFFLLVYALTISSCACHYLVGVSSLCLQQGCEWGVCEGLLWGVIVVFSDDLLLSACC